MADDEVLAPSCCGDTSVLESVKAATGAVVATFPEQQLLGFINPTIDRTGHMIAIEASDAMVLDNRGTTIWSRSQPTGPYAGASTNTFAFSPDGQRLAIGTSTEVEVFDIAANRLLATLPGISESAAFTADGNELIVGGSLSTAQRYLTDTWAPIGRSITNFPSGILSMRARADGLLVILSNGLRLSDLATGTSVGRELKVSTNLLASGFADGLISADGLKVTTRNSEEDGVVVWDLNPADWPVAACLAAGRNLTKAEWVASFGDEPYRVTCDGWPAND
jgi:WD40 repeat protein